MHGQKIARPRKEAPERIRNSGACLSYRARIGLLPTNQTGKLENCIIHKALSRILRSVLPQQWGRVSSRLNTALDLPSKSKSKIQKDETISKLLCPRTKFKNIYGNTKIYSSQQGKTHNVWHPIKYYQVCKEAGKYNP